MGSKRSKIWKRTIFKIKNRKHSYEYTYMSKRTNAKPQNQQEAARLDWMKKFWEHKKNLKNLIYCLKNIYGLIKVLQSGRKLSERNKCL